LKAERSQRTPEIGGTATGLNGGGPGQSSGESGETVPDQHLHSDQIISKGNRRAALAQEKVDVSHHGNQPDTTKARYGKE
jgi:hypothetical protein